MVSAHRLTATSLAHPRSYGCCSACDKRLKPGDEIVHLYGEIFHYDCAFYRRFTTARDRPSKPAEPTHRSTVRIRDSGS